MHYKTITLSLSMTILLGCSTAPLQKGHGTSTENNARMQVINPDAGKGPATEVTLDGQKSERLLKSYRADSGKSATSSLIELK